ncbi:MAG: hypothetical protein P8N76_12400 [Pirellulaceae bacterium]|nr:hypothetical protein [Pirellulaceae bacterium]
MLKRSLTAVTLCLVISSALQASFFVPSGLEAGDTFQLVFVTHNLRDTTLTDIAGYNTFVQNEALTNAALTGADATQVYTAIASTKFVNAKTNANVYGPVYNMAG